VGDVGRVRIPLPTHIFGSHDFAWLPARLHGTVRVRVAYFFAFGRVFFLLLALI
jgi:hypothetical protein